MDQFYGFSHKRRSRKSPARAAAGKHAARRNPWIIFMKKFRASPRGRSMIARGASVTEIARAAGAAYRRGGRGGYDC